MLWEQVFLNLSLSLTVLDQCVDSTHSMYGETQMLCNSLGQSVLMQLITRQKFSAFTGCENSKSYKTQKLCISNFQTPPAPPPLSPLKERFTRNQSTKEPVHVQVPVSLFQLFKGMYVDKIIKLIIFPVGKQTEGTRLRPI